MRRYAEFISRYPSYDNTHDLDELRQREYSRLDRLGHVYLDYTGGGLYAESQLRQHHDLLKNHVFGNPHSTNPTSLAATALVESARESVLRYFNASPDEYVCVFTSNASGALKLVGESYPFTQGSRYLLTFDNHNSVNGIREFARAKGAEVDYVPVALPDMRLPEALLEEALNRGTPGVANLFAYPAQSNFSSVQHPLEWIDRAHRLGWDVLLDAAAFTPTNRLDLSRWKPDFVPLSFYKMFGYPTGIGALLMRWEAAKKLRRPWFAGGTITVASVQGDTYYLAEPPAAFEDGTLDYLNIPAVEIGLRHLQSVGIEMIHDRVRCLTGWLLEHLNEMRHSNGKPLVKIYGPLDTYQRGGAVALNFFDANGAPIDIRKIEQEAAARKISLRTGCFCNPGAGEIALQISRMELVACFSHPSHVQRLTYDDFRTCIDGKASGAVRISVGMVSNFEDIEAMLDFARSLLQ
ncbi:MAG: aminotransferase class V-fold PLP-dependent enzyme [Anaerolineales bacterium]|nr:aminotransferase class V-fold PLP-dependent enzyme [Anaerolineales bacterium]MCX7608675.1 aminotransferase class V-fold PLP-dependent enzyme [Anaerolineales bacterium]MDW8226708.1 aminotransferase class V-fold PLP-dependent enzyme [Anaerolineales bacterium]